MNLKPETLKQIDEVITHYPVKRSATLPLLHLIQEDVGWISKEAIEWIEAQPSPRDGKPVRVLVAANENSRWCAAYFASDRLAIETTLVAGQPGDLPPGINYYVGTSRAGMDRSFPAARVVRQIGREGAVFATVKQPTSRGVPPSR